MSDIETGNGDEREHFEAVDGDESTGERVRITGAVPVVGPLGESDSGFDIGVDPSVARSPDEPPESTDTVQSEPEMAHWTEAPTGEVPAVLARDPDASDDPSDPWAGLAAPAWREEHADWEAGEVAFEPAMLAEDKGRLGSLDDSFEAERQPWTFDLDETRPDSAGDLSKGAEAVLDPDDRSRFDTLDLNAYGDEDTIVAPAIKSTPSPLKAHQESVDEQEISQGERSGEIRSANRTPLERREDLEELRDNLDRANEDPKLDRSDREAELRGNVDSLQDPGDHAQQSERVSNVRARRARGLRHSRVASRNGRELGVQEATDTDGPALLPGHRPPIRPSLGPQRARNMPVAVAIGLILFLVVLGAFDLGAIAAMAVSTVVVLLGSVEAFAAFRRAGYQPAVLLGWVGTVALMVATYDKGTAALPLVLVMMVAFTMIWYLLGVEPGADPVIGAASTLFVFAWVGVFGSFAALLLSPSMFPHRHGVAYLIGAIVVTVAYDVGALAIGSRLGSHPLAPTASPGKTWEGFFGGAVAAVLAGVVIVQFIHPWTVPAAAALGVLVAVVAPIGDLCESLIKRHLGLKDMGRLLPGHGGVLDRIDGLLFVLPATYFLVKAFGLA